MVVKHLKYLPEHRLAGQRIVGHRRDQVVEQDRQRRGCLLVRMTATGGSFNISAIRETLLDQTETPTDCPASCMSFGDRRLMVSVMSLMLARSKSCRV